MLLEVFIRSAGYVLSKFEQVLDDQPLSPR